MFDFKEYLAKGLDAAARAQANRDEIVEILNELNAQLAEATEGKIQITELHYNFGYCHPPAETPPGAVINALACYNPKAKSVIYERVAGWRVSRFGYPCEIDFADEESFCEDRASLETHLALMLADPDVGEQVFKIMNSPTNAN